MCITVEQLLVMLFYSQSRRSVSSCLPADDRPSHIARGTTSATPLYRMKTATTIRTQRERQKAAATE